jgi:hypothetical protein
MTQAAEQQHALDLQAAQAQQAQAIEGQAPAEE